MTLKIGVSSTWKPVSSVKVGVGGAWKTVSKMWIGVGGVWKEMYNTGAVSVSISGLEDIKSSGTAIASLTLYTDGVMLGTGNGTVLGANSWFTPTTTGIGSSYWAKLVVNSGTNPTGAATNTVLALTSDRAWSWAQAISGSKSASCTLYIYSDSGGTNLVTSDSFSVYVERA